MNIWSGAWLAVLLPACAAGDWQANLGAVSEYTSRGWSQSDGRPVLQGGADASLPAGLWLSGWGSGVRWPGTPGRLELDLGAGGSGTLGPLEWEAGYTRIFYPENRGADYSELELGLSAGPWEGEAMFSPDYAGGGRPAAYLGSSVERPLWGGWALRARLGLFLYSDKASAALFGLDAIHHSWDGGLGVVWRHGDLELRVDGEGVDAETRRLADGAADLRFVGGLAYAWPSSGGE